MRHICTDFAVVTKFGGPLGCDLISTTLRLKFITSYCYVFCLQILFVLSFLSYAIAHLSGLPNRELTDREFELSPKNSEDDVSFRSLSYGHTSPSDEDEEFDNENDLNDVDFDEEVDREVGLPSITNNKRSPNSVSILKRMF